MATARAEPEAIADARRFIIHPRNGPGQSALERVQELCDKAKGLPREGVRADGKPIPAGVPSLTEHWAAIESDAKGKRLRHPVLPELVSETDEAPTELKRLNAAERSELRGIARGQGRKLPTDWADEDQK